MFAYCNNNPICHADPAGDVLIEVTLSTVGAIVGITVCGVLIVHYGAMLLKEFFEWLSAQWYAPFATVTYIEEEEQLPDVTYPGDDPEKAPEGYEWRGEGEQGSKEGGYFNKDTKESLRPDLDHPDGIDPHWDYNYRGSGCKGWRIFANGVIEKKLMMTLIITAVEWWDEYGR